MDPWVIVSLVLGAVLAGVVAIAIRRGRALEEARSTARRRHVSGADDARRHADERDAEAVLHEAIGAGVLRLDRALRVVEASGVAHRLLGRTPGALVGRSVMEAFLDPGIESVVRSAFGQETATGELRLDAAEGSALVVRARRVPTGDAVWLVIDDVSELRRLQRIRAEFIDNLSHELRTPLTTVSLLAETLTRDAEAAGDGISPKMRDRIGKIEVETGHLVQMVTELLDLSRIESGGTIDLADGLDVAGIIGSSAERLRSFAERQGVDLAIDVPRSLPSVRGDAARIGQVVVNLVHNAVKFSPDGGTVRVSARVDGDELTISVEDHGVGIPRAAQQRVFERFYKVDRARLRPEVGGGTGLGLAIARHVVEQHRGRIWVDSTEGVGSTFRFTIPLPSAAADTMA